jgi:hypothetical protein
MKILDYAVARKLGIAYSGGAHSLAEKAIAQKLGGGSGGNTGGGGVAHLTFYNEDGTSVLQIVECKDGADGDYSGTTPTKASTAQYTYSFAGWSGTIGGAVDPNALKNVTADRSVYAAFTATVRTYTVTWYNGSTLLETDTNVPYGTVPTYNGADPTHTNPDYVWNGWSPAVGAITGDTTYTAQFKDTSYVYAKLIDRSITEISSNATSIGDYAFSNCAALTVLILRSETMCTLSATTVFNNTPIKSGGTGFIYVPRALVDSYKAATNWSTYASQFRAIEDYPDICGGESA